MSNVNRRKRGKSLHLDLPGGIDERPPLSALFLVQFDIKAGYTISWKKCEPGLELQDSVEFKSLPSGLHNVDEDLVYFMHGDDYAGISAFVKTDAGSSERNALMLAVGALVPLEQGRLGRSWKHASELKRLAHELARAPTETRPLDEYWQTNQAHPEATGEAQNESETRNPKPRRASVASTGSRSKRRSLGAVPTMNLSSYHPARSISSLIDTFGPLVYSVYKAALLRKRILLICEAPIQLSCNFVYDISILSNIPSAVADLIPLEPLPSRLQPLFAVGVHDIDDLSKRGGITSMQRNGEHDFGHGWIACSTDDVLAMKSDLYDVTIRIPSHHTKQAQEKIWPTVKTSAGEEIKATQRDARRYRVLRQSQKKFLATSQAVSPALSGSRHFSADSVAEDDEEDDEADESPLLKSDDFDDGGSVSDEKVIEPMSWSALAYDSFMWWASAGEKRTDLDEESERDASMFRNLEPYSDRPGSSQSKRNSMSIPTTPGAMIAEGLSVPPEMAVIAYFHRLTSTIIERLAKLIDETDNVEPMNGANGESLDAKDDTDSVYIGRDDMVHMGLDIWSETDKNFVEELVEFYFGRKADVQGGRVECCGIRIM